MRRAQPLRRLPVAGIVVALGLAVLWATAPAFLTRAQDRVFDMMLRLTPAPDSPVPVRVVDFGATDDSGADWGRAAMARLVAALGRGGAALVVHDVVYSGDCANAATLAMAMAGTPQVLGALPAAATTIAAPLGPVALGDGVAPGLIAVPGAELPCPVLRDAGAAVGSTALFGDADAAIRQVPLVVLAGGQTLPSLALSAVAGDRQAVILADGPGRSLLGLGEDRWTLDAAGRIRLDPAPLADQAARTLAANAVLDGSAGAEAVLGAIVVIGSSLPQRGGLRPTAAGPLTPSVQIQADLITTLLSGTVPQRPPAAARVEAALILLGGVIAAVMIARLPPLVATGWTALIAAGWAGAAATVFALSRWLIDPVGPVLSLGLIAAVALAWRATTAAGAERRLRSRLGQQLPPAIVTRLAENPGLFRLDGELREVTALFTDIEGFSTTARTLGPTQLVRLLDGYFDTVCGLVLAHGGMVDKIVGDSVHAYFNAPLDQPGHADAAIACARAILTQTGRLQAGDTALGRTRIGIESGPAVLGDVGAAGRIDYTAHGDAVNLAARLQEVNKDTGTCICIGPGAAALTTAALRPLGDIAVRSFGTLRLFTVRD